MDQAIGGYQVIVSHLRLGHGLRETQACANNADVLMALVATYGRQSPDAVAIFTNHLRLLGASPADWTNRPMG